MDSDGVKDQSQNFMSVPVVQAASAAACVLEIEPGWQRWQPVLRGRFCAAARQMIAKVMPAHPTNPPAIFVSGHRSPFEAI